MFLQLRSKNTAPIATQIADPIVAGANLANTSTFSTQMVELLAVAPSLQNLVRYFLTKSPSGVVSLHAMVPYQRMSLRRNNDNGRPTIQRTTMFVGINCNKNEYDTKEQGIHVISENLLAMSELSLESGGTYNGVVVAGSPIENYIPYNVETWTKPFKDGTVGQVANDLTLNTFFKLQALAMSLNDENLEVDSDKVHEEMTVLWNKYVNSEQALVSKNILVKSDLLYANSCSLVPLATVFQHTTSDVNPYLDSRKVFGNANAGASYAPTISVVCASGVITPKEADEVSGYKYGQVAVSSNRDEIVVVADEAKPTTLETTTRELAVHDGSGRTAFMQLTVNDLQRNGKIIKRSTNLADLPVGTAVKVNGTLSLRTQREKCLAVKFRISDAEWTTEGQTSSLSAMTANFQTNFDDAEALFDNLIEGTDTDSVDTSVLEQIASEQRQDQQAEESEQAPQANTGGVAGF